LSFHVLRQFDVKFLNITNIVHIGIPSATISTDVPVYVGSATKIHSKITACPLPEVVSWQKSSDEVTFETIDVKKPKYFGSSLDPSNPFLFFAKATFDDKLYYRLLVRNKIGQRVSNTVYLNVTGSMCISA
jgi:hypothetical protein